MTEGYEGRNIRFVVRVHHAKWTYHELLRIWREAERVGYDGGSLYDLLGAPASNAGRP